jgi:hypothetical protein
MIVKHLEPRTQVREINGIKSDRESGKKWESYTPGIK